MVTLKSSREIEQMKESGAILAGIHKQLREIIVPGITTNEINQFSKKESKPQVPPQLKLALKAMNLRPVRV